MVASHAPSVHVAVTVIGLSHAQVTFPLNVTVQLPELSMDASTEVAPFPQSTVTFSSPVAQPVAVPATTIDVGSVAFAGRIPTTDVIVIVQAMIASS